MDVENKKSYKELMDEIMELQHEIVSYLEEYMEKEVNGAVFDENKLFNNKIFKILYGKLQLLYNELQEKIDNGEMDDSLGNGWIEQIDKEQMDEIVLVDKNYIINLLKAYITKGYLELRYISLMDAEGNIVQDGIYRSRGTQKLRNTEYNVQGRNLDTMNLRNQLKDKASNFSFYEKSLILSDIVEKNFLENMQSIKLIDI